MTPRTVPLGRVSLSFPVQFHRVFLFFFPLSLFFFVFWFFPRLRLDESFAITLAFWDASPSGEQVDGRGQSHPFLPDVEILCVVQGKCRSWRFTLMGSVRPSMSSLSAELPGTQKVHGLGIGGWSGGCEDQYAVLPDTHDVHDLGFGGGVSDGSSGKISLRSC